MKQDQAWHPLQRSDRHPSSPSDASLLQELGNKKQSSNPCCYLNREPGRNYSQPQGEQSLGAREDHSLCQGGDGVGGDVAGPGGSQDPSHRKAATETKWSRGARGRGVSDREGTSSGAARRPLQERLQRWRPFQLRCCWGGGLSCTQACRCSANRGTWTLRRRHRLGAPSSPLD